MLFSELPVALNTGGENAFRCLFPAGYKKESKICITEDLTERIMRLA